jgi:membrane protease YdiL (CAAX protease family)
VKAEYKLLILLLAVLAISIALAPFLKLACDAGAQSGGAVARLLKYDAAENTYNFGRAVRRMMMIVLVVVFVSQTRRLGLPGIIRTGFRPARSAPGLLLQGVLLGVVSLTIYVIAQWLTGVREVRINPEGGGPLVVIAKLFKYVFSSSATALFEEILFRGILLGVLLRRWRAGPAVIGSSVVYSLLHFFKSGFDVVADGSFQPWIGLRLVGRFLEPLVTGELWSNVPQIVGLFLAGVVLCVAVMRTGNLYAAMGIHAGWIFVLKTSKLMLAREVTHLRWLFGPGGSAGGVLSWVMLLGLWAAIVALYPKPPAAAPPPPEAGSEP